MIRPKHFKTLPTVFFIPVQCIEQLLIIIRIKLHIHFSQIVFLWRGVMFMFSLYESALKLVFKNITNPKTYFNEYYINLKCIVFSGMLLLSTKLPLILNRLPKVFTLFVSFST